MHVLVVAGPFAAGRRLTEHLRFNDWLAEYADCGSDALELAQRKQFDIVVASLDLPDMRGTELIRRMRMARLDVPVIALSPASHAIMRAAALNAGADDVMSLPLDEAELMMRLKVLVRRSRGHSQNLLSAGPVSVNLDTHEATVNGHTVNVTAKEFAVLSLLVLRCNSPVAKETFLSQLYSDANQVPEPKIIDVFICKLRQKLAAAGAKDVIETVWGLGYMMRSRRHERSNGGPCNATTPAGPVPEMA